MWLPLKADDTWKIFLFYVCGGLLVNSIVFIPFDFKSIKTIGTLIFGSLFFLFRVSGLRMRFVACWFMVGGAAGCIRLFGNFLSCSIRERACVVLEFYPAIFAIAVYASIGIVGLFVALRISKNDQRSGT
jgi:hypothetical protein